MKIEHRDNDGCNYSEEELDNILGSIGLEYFQIQKPERNQIEECKHKLTQHMARDKSAVFRLMRETVENYQKYFNLKMLIPVTTLILIILVIGYKFVGDFSKNDDIAIPEYDQITIDSSYAFFNYRNLKQYADVIALVRIKDELTLDNSRVYYNQNNSIWGFNGLRRAEVIKFYKNERNLKQEITFIEPAAYTTNKKYLISSDYESVKKDNLYIVFLSDDSASGELGVISAKNGLVDLSSLSNNVYPEIVIKFLVEFESSLNPDQKSFILKSNIGKEVSSKSKQEKLFDINTEYGNIILYNSESNNKLDFQFK